MTAAKQSNMNSNESSLRRTVWNVLRSIAGSGWRGLPSGMSYSFYVETKKPPALARLIETLGLEDLRCIEEAEVSEGLHPGFCFHLYRHGLSTRSVEVAFEKGMLQARVMTCASPDEYELALRLCEEAARMAGVGEIQSEEGAALTLGDRGEYDAEWVEWMVGAGYKSLLAIGTRSGSVKLDGPNRPFAFGPRCVAMLESTPEDARPGHLLDMMRRVQYPNDETLYVDKVMEVDKDGGGTFTFATMAADVDYFLTRAQYLALVCDRFLLVPFDAGPELVAERWKWLDDDHATVAAVPQSEWPAVLDRAARLADDPR
jgi:hypothetical protein